MTGRSNSVRFLFESSTSKGWVGPLADSTLCSTKVATQNAGSINASLYYQVGGSGMNGLFAARLSASHRLAEVNGMLKTRYDNRFGTGAWEADSSAVPPRSDRLTSFLIELKPDGINVGNNVEAMIYSVGPVLGKPGLVNETQYQQIYFDAIEAIDAWNQRGHTIAGLRITMLSCGIYAGLVDDKDLLYEKAAENIIVGIARAVRRFPRPSGLNILVNTNDSVKPPEHNGKPHIPRERPAFTAAAHGLGITVDTAGFTVDVLDDHFR